MPTQLVMNSSDDLDQLARWHERLPVYARTQGSYLNDLLAQGFDQEQAFLLVRDWSSRTMYWACDARQAFPEAPDFIPLDPEHADLSVASSNEDYLIAAIDPPFGSQPLRQEDLADLTNVVHLENSRSNSDRDGEASGQKPLFDDVDDSRLDEAA